MFCSQVLKTLHILNKFQVQCFSNKVIFVSAREFRSTAIVPKSKLGWCIVPKRNGSNLKLSDKKDGRVSNRTEKAKQAGKDASYMMVIVFGVIAIGGVFYVLSKELLFKSGPTKIFSNALEECRNNQQVAVALGTPIEGFGEMSSRRRRQHVAHLPYVDAQGREAMRMKFHLKGSTGRTATVELDARIENRQIKYRYIMANVEIYPPRTIIVKDERSQIDLFCDESPT